MLNYYLICKNIWVQVDKDYFFKVVDLLSEHFEIWKIDCDGKPVIKDFPDIYCIYYDFCIFGESQCFGKVEYAGV